MSLPTYNKNARRKSFETLPKGAYVVKITNAKEEKWPSGDSVIRIAFDIAEGEYKDFYQKQFDADTKEDKKWPFDAVFNLNVPTDDSKDYIWTEWNTFFADLEDSNNGFVFDGDVKKLRGKLIGGKFRNEQSSYKGNVYDHTKLKWTCVAEDVRTGNAGKMPKDKLVESNKAGSEAPQVDADGFMTVPDGVDEEVPF